MLLPQKKRHAVCKAHRDALQRVKNEEEGQAPIVPLEAVTAVLAHIILLGRGAAPVNRARGVPAPLAHTTDLLLYVV